MKVSAAQGLARILKAEGVPWVACYPTNHVNNALGAEQVPILMMREERYAVAVADAFSRVTGGQQIGVCALMGGLNAAGLQLAYGAVAQAFEDSSPVLVKFRPLMESNEKPINPYRVFGDLMKVLDPKSSFVTGDSGNTRDQVSTVYEAQIPRGFLGWGNVSTLGFGLAAALGAKLAYPEWQCVNITGDAGVSYMMGNFEAVARYGLGVTTIHINNGGFAGYGPGFWGPGHDPYTHEVSDHSQACMAAMARAQGYYAEDVTEPLELIPALRRALEANAKHQPAYLEVICSQHPVYGNWIRDAQVGH